MANIHSLVYMIMISDIVILYDKMQFVNYNESFLTRVNEMYEMNITSLKPKMDEIIYGGHS